MPTIRQFLKEIEQVTDRDVEWIEAWLRRHRPECEFIPAAGRFAGMFHVDPKTGVTIVATQQLSVGVASTAPLVFTDSTGLVGPGPIGTISSSDPSVTVSLSADGQSANATMTTTLPTPAVLTWHDPAGNVQDFTVSVTDAAVVGSTQTGAFGTFVAGTTP